MRLVKVVELASDVCPACGFTDAALFVKPVETCVSISLQNALIVPQVRRRMLALAIRRISEPDRGWRFAARGPVVANIRPQTARLCLAVARLQHRNRHIVAVQFLRAEYIRLQRLNQRPQRPARAAYPIGERGAVEFNAFA